MGDLKRERIVAKHAARQSLVSYDIQPINQVPSSLLFQALSTSRAIRLDVKTTRDYPDIQRNG
jgi:hypothetical protein